MEKEMLLEQFMDMAHNTSSFVMNIQDYNIHIKYFCSGYELNDAEQEFFTNRVKKWEESGANFGQEPFFWPNGEVAGIIQYGKIN